VAAGLKITGALLRARLTAPSGARNPQVPAMYIAVSALRATPSGGRSRRAPAIFPFV